MALLRANADIDALDLHRDLLLISSLYYSNNTEIGDNNRNDLQTNIWMKYSTIVSGVSVQRVKFVLLDRVWDAVLGKYRRNQD